MMVETQEEWASNRSGGLAVGYYLASDDASSLGSYIRASRFTMKCNSQLALSWRKRCDQDNMNHELGSVRGYGVCNNVRHNSEFKFTICAQ